MNKDELPELPGFSDGLLRAVAGYCSGTGSWMAGREEIHRYAKSYAITALAAMQAGEPVAILSWNFALEEWALESCVFTEPSSELVQVFTRPPAMQGRGPVYFVKRTDQQEWLETNADTARAMVSGNYRDGIKFEQRILYTRPPSTSEAEAMLAWLSENTVVTCEMDDKLFSGTCKVVFHYPATQYPENLPDAIRAAMKGAGS